MSKHINGAFVAMEQTSLPVALGMKTGVQLDPCELCASTLHQASLLHASVPFFPPTDSAPGSLSLGFHLFIISLSLQLPSGLSIPL